MSDEYDRIVSMGWGSAASADLCAPAQSRVDQEILAAALEVPEVKALVEAAKSLITHDGFDPIYLSASLNSKLAATRTALAALKGGTSGTEQ